MKIDVRVCQRCGKDHKLKIYPLRNGTDGYNYWGNCKNTDQPVMVKITTVNSASSVPPRDNSNIFPSGYTESKRPNTTAANTINYPIGRGR